MELADLMSPESQTLHLRVENVRLSVQEAFRNTATLFAGRENFTAEEYIKFSVAVAEDMKLNFDKGVELIEKKLSEKKHDGNPRLPSPLSRPS